MYDHFFSQAVYTPEGWRQVEQLLGEVSGNQASGQAPIKYDPKFFEWNFGFNLMVYGAPSTGTQLESPGIPLFSWTTRAVARIFKRSRSSWRSPWSC